MIKRSTDERYFEHSETIMSPSNPSNTKYQLMFLSFNPETQNPAEGDLSFMFGAVATAQISPQSQKKLVFQFST